MQENEFEKKVRGLMDDLEIAPSAPVWDYVEKRIPKSNRRRRFIAFFFLLAGVAVCGYFFYNKFSNNKNESVKAGTEVQQNNIPSQKNNENNTAKNNQPVYTDSSVTIQQSIAGKNETIISKDHSQQQTISLKKVEVNAIQTKDETEKKKEMVTSIADRVNKYNNDTKKEQLNTADRVKQNETIITELAKSENAFDSSTVTIKQTDITTAGLKINDTAKQNKQIKKLPGTTKKLEWGFSALYGRSDIVQSLINLNANKNAADYSYTPGNIPNESASFAASSKNIKARSAVSFGIAVRKPLSSRSSITTGIEFLHMTTQIHTGVIKDSTAVFYYNNSRDAVTSLNNFYTPGTGRSQINRYNLLQIPVLYSYQINKSKKIPLMIDAGFSFSRIISSNAFIYDSYNQAYYKNENLLKKTQIQLLGGFNTTFTFHNKSSLYVGPQFQYGLTSVIKNNSNSQHFFTWGLGARYFIKK